MCRRYSFNTIQLIFDNQIDKTLTECRHLANVSPTKSDKTTHIQLFGETFTKILFSANFNLVFGKDCRASAKLHSPTNNLSYIHIGNVTNHYFSIYTEYTNNNYIIKYNN